jgi:hypothetical protein
MTDAPSSDPKLVLRAEALVAQLSTREPDWDALAERVSARLDAAPAADDALLAAPFPEADGESELDRLVRPKAAAPETSAPREGVSLADLARASVARRGNRDAASIAKESLALASQSRSQAERTPERAPSAATPAPTPLHRSGGAGSDTRGPWIGVAIAAIGLAAGFGLYIAGQQRQAVVTLPPTNVPTVNAAEKAEAPAPEQVAPRAPSETTEAPIAKGFTELPAAEVPSGRPAAAVGEAARPAESVAKALPGRPFGGGVAPERVVLDEERPNAPGSAAAQRSTKSAPSAELRPAELSENGGTSDRPSAGAAQAAVGAVLGAARACIAGHATPSSATLIFGSNGQVDRVNVNGPAAGTPAAACVESALKKARVQPFAADSFSLGVTVRPP